jgi:hypothetical protein
MILHVDTSGDFAHRAKGISEVLGTDGHSVTSILNGADGLAALNGLLDSYGLVVWDSWSNSGADFAHLSTYVASGGRVLVLGYDSVFQAEMSAFLGGSSVSDLYAAADPVVNVANSLTTGVEDIRGRTPAVIGDLDALNGLLPETSAVLQGSGRNLWTIRHLGLGEIAFMSTTFGFNFETGDAVYRAALRNFASTSGRQGGFNATQAPEPASTALLCVGVGLLTCFRNRLCRRQRDKQAA